jgi:hypothetical protein
VELRLADSSPDGYLVAPPAADSLRGGYSADSSPDDCLVAPAADSPRGDYSVDSSQDDYSVVPPAADSSPGDYSADSSRDDYSVVPRVAGLFRGDCWAALEPVGSAAPPADDSAVRERARPDARLEPADFPAGLPVG